MDVEEDGAVAFLQNRAVETRSGPRIDSSTPADTWPGIIGYGTPASRPCQRCTSVPQTSDRAVRRREAPSGRVGSRELADFDRLSRRRHHRRKDSSRHLSYIVDSVSGEGVVYHAVTGRDHVIGTRIVIVGLTTRLCWATGCATGADETRDCQDQDAAAATKPARRADPGIPRSRQPGSARLCRLPVPDLGNPRDPRPVRK